jgi:hypothetical protein
MHADEQREQTGMMLLGLVNTPKKYEVVTSSDITLIKSL